MYQTEYGDYYGKHINVFMLKNFLKDIIRPITNKIVLFKCKNIWNVKKKINKEGLEGGIYTSFYHDYFKRRNAYIGMDTQFANTPCFPHGFSGIHISEKAKIGKDCVIFQNVTIGLNNLADSKKKGAPTIGDNVYIGAGAKIIGNITVGDNCRIGAGAVVAEDIPDNTVVVMNKPRLIKKKNMDNRYITIMGKSEYAYENGEYVKI